MSESGGVSTGEKADAEALLQIRAACRTLLESNAVVLVNLAVRTLAEVRSCETQLPGVEPPSHLVDVE